MPFTWNFTDGLGRFSGSNLSIVANKLAITPELGDEMWDAAAAAFTSGTYAWVAQGGNTIANVANALAITYVDNAAGAKELLNDAADLSANLTVGQWYQFQATQSINSGSAYLDFFNSLDRLGLIITTTPTVMKLCGLATNATTNFIYNSGLNAGEIVTVDNLSLRSITLNTMVAGGLPASRSNIIVKAAWTAGVARGRVFGVAACLDSYTNPQNGLFALSDGSHYELYKLVIGIWTNIINGSATYVAGANVEIDTLLLPAVTLRYNGVQIGTTQTVTNPTIINNRLHAPFAGDSDSRCNSFSITAN